MNTDTMMRQAVDQGQLTGITPVFVVGPPRCGTTWVQRTLDAHPDAVVSGETNVFNLVGWPLLNLLDQFRRQVPVQLPLRDGVRPTIPAFSDGDILRTLRIPVERALLAHLAEAGRLSENRPRVVGDKSPGHARHVRLLAGMFPEARFILCTRDVRDACVSAWKHFHDYKDDGLLAPAKTMHEGAEIFARHHWAELVRFSRGPGRELGPERFLELGFEEHHADPHASVHRMLEFLGLERSAPTIDAIVSSNTFEALSGGRSRGQEDVRTVFRRGLTGEWREHFTEEFGAYLLQVAEERLARGEEPVDNRSRIEWTGPTTRPEPVEAA